MKILIDTDDLIQALRSATVEESKFPEGLGRFYSIGRNDAIRHAARMFAIPLSFDMDRETYRQFLYDVVPGTERPKIAA